MGVINYQEEYNKQLKINISKVRNEINNDDFVLKITNHAEKFGRDYNEVKDKIMSDDMYAEIFSKDPAKQNLYEKLAANYIKGLEHVKDFKNLSNNVKVFMVDGKITNKRQNEVKSIDFTFNVNGNNIYVSHKYIKATYGGAQDNQYNDIRNFLRNCNKIEGGNDFYIAICDGRYFDDKLNILNDEFGTKNVKAMTIDELNGFITDLI
jgi:hypothetical protein